VWSLKTVELDKLIRKYALQNAVPYSGRASSQAVLGKLLADCPDLKPRVKKLIPIVETIVNEVNVLPLSQQKQLLTQISPESAVKKSEHVDIGLSPLPNVELYPFVHVRFCPNPDGALHLGGARAAILCDEYAKLYNGRFTLRFDDTDPRTKSPIPEAYNWITRDLEWLNVKWHDRVYQSDRLETYYEYAEQLLKMGAAYVCTCPSPEFRKLIWKNRACPCRDLSPERHLKRWNRMLSGSFAEGDAVVRIKTDLNHPNPAVREWPALRIIDTIKFPHPRTKSKYRVWPLFAFCCGVDDHELQISHIIRGKEHLTNSVRQQFLYDYLHWKYPEAIHYGRFKIVGSVLSKSKIREEIAHRYYHGWDDPRLGTLMALRKRGFQPETVRQLILDVGVKPVDLTISWQNIQAINRKILDPIAHRFFFVANPIALIVNDVKKTYISSLPLHPNNPKAQQRTLIVKPIAGSAHLLISKSDLDLIVPGKTVRLMSLFNIHVESVGEQIDVRFHSEDYAAAKQMRASLIHWLPRRTGVTTSVVMPDASTCHGIAENACEQLKPGDIIQFERFGFVRIDHVSESEVRAYYAHR
jgi:glutamyl-tRNA synthetase